MGGVGLEIERWKNGLIKLEEGREGFKIEIKRNERLKWKIGMMRIWRNN